MPPAPGLRTSGPDWSPDSARLVFASVGRLYLVGGDGTGLTPLGGGVEPAFSPDGTAIAFTRAGDIWTMRPDGSAAANITHSPVTESDPTWQPVTLPVTPPTRAQTPCAIVGTEGDDVLVDTDGPDVFYDLGGEDVIRGLGGERHRLGRGRQRLDRDRRRRRPRQAGVRPQRAPCRRR